MSAQLPRLSITLGSDPEFFLARRTKVKGKIKKVIVGAEKVLPEEGLKVKSGWIGRDNKITIDGVQAEINPVSDTCRARHTNEMKRIFLAVAKQMKKHKGLTIEWAPTVRVTSKEMNSLADKNKEFGCDPSYSAYKEQMQFPDPFKCKQRWAGGHIHLGNSDKAGLAWKTLRNPEHTVKILDIIVGNTCVLIDRDPGNKARRKTYGRAGEYRLPPHGLEYRTLSNFWLRSNQLMSFVYALSRFAVEVAASPELAEMVIKAVKEKDIRMAINNNDFDKAKANFEKIRFLFEKYAYADDPLCKENLEAFDVFVKKGIKHYFKQDPLKHWTTVAEGHTGNGWESFLRKIQVEARQKVAAKKLAA